MYTKRHFKVADTRTKEFFLYSPPTHKNPAKMQGFWRWRRVSNINRILFNIFDFSYIAITQ